MASSRYRRIETRLWTDAKFRGLSAAAPNAQTLWLWLLTSRHSVVIPGVIPVGDYAIAEDLGWQPEDVRRVFAEIERAEMASADWEARLVFVHNAMRRNRPQSPNVITAWANAWEDVPECDLKVEVFRAIARFVSELPKAFQILPESFSDSFGRISKAFETVERKEEKDKERGGGGVGGVEPAPGQPDAKRRKKTQAALLPAAADAAPRGCMKIFLAKLGEVWQKHTRRPPRITPGIERALKARISEGATTADFERIAEYVFTGPDDWHRRTGNCTLGYISKAANFEKLIAASEAWRPKSDPGAERRGEIAKLTRRLDMDPPVQEEIEKLATYPNSVLENCLAEHRGAINRDGHYGSAIAALKSRN